MTITDAKPPAPVHRKARRWGIPLAIAAGAFFLLLAPLWAPVLLRRMAFFRVRHVEVVGARYVDGREILQLLKVDTLDSVWDARGPLESRVGQHPLVRIVRVGRRLPGTLVVQLVEYVPVALVATPNGFRVYDERGVALPIDPTVAEVDAPVLTRPDTGILRFLGTARQQRPEFYTRLSELRREPEGDLVLVLDSLPVRVPADVSLQRLSDLDLVEQDLARRQLRAAELDLRYRDQVIARLQ